MSIELNAVNETYRDVERLIYKLAWKAREQHGGHVDDYVSAGNEGFVDAYATYDADKGACFSTWVYWKIKGAITHEARQNAMEQHTVNAGENIDLDIFTEKTHFDFGRFVDDLNYDARVVAKMLIESPNEISDILHHKDIDSAVRNGLCRRLKAFGWSVARVSESFSEIREALQ